MKNQELNCCLYIYVGVSDVSVIRSEAENSCNLSCEDRQQQRMDVVGASLRSWRD